MMIEKIDKPWEDQAFLSMLKDYEQELHSIDSDYPMGRTVSILDVTGFQAFVATENGRYLGFIVLGIENDECEIHEFYVIPEYRNAVVAKGLLEVAFDSGSRLVFNIFRRNVRVQTLAERILKKTCGQVVTGEKVIWGTDCLHYNLRTPS